MKKSTKLTIFFEDFVLKQEFNDDKNKNNKFFEDKSNKEATKKKTKNKKRKNENDEFFKQNKIEKETKKFKTKKKRKDDVKKIKTKNKNKGKNFKTNKTTLKLKFNIEISSKEAKISRFSLITFLL